MRVSKFKLGKDDIPLQKLKCRWDEWKRGPDFDPDVFEALIVNSQWERLNNIEGIIDVFLCNLDLGADGEKSQPLGGVERGRSSVKFVQYRKWEGLGLVEHLQVFWRAP